jgi:tRNA(adenine34) deaminase
VPTPDQPARTPDTLAEDEHFMRAALREAVMAYEIGEVPVGSIVVKDGKIIARGHNQRELLHDPTAHAEMLAVTSAAEATGEWRLEGCTLYVTLEPCPMCAGALVNARVARLVFGATDPKAGACGSLFNLVQDPRLNHRMAVTQGVMAADCSAILKAFFRERRGINTGGTSTYDDGGEAG